MPVSVIINNREVHVLTIREYFNKRREAWNIYTYIKYILCLYIKHNILETSPLEIACIINELADYEKRKKSNTLKMILHILETVVKGRKLYDGMWINTWKIHAAIREFVREIEREGVENVLKKYLI